MPYPESTYVDDWQKERAGLAPSGSMTLDCIQKLVGVHNYFNVGVFTAEEYVRMSIEAAGLEGGWRVTSTGERDRPPPDSVLVGYVRVRSGDPQYPLYVMRKPHSGG